jgi:hypothetical protein
MRSLAYQGSNDGDIGVIAVSHHVQRGASRMRVRGTPNVTPLMA